MSKAQAEVDAADDGFNPQAQSLSGRPIARALAILLLPLAVVAVVGFAFGFGPAVLVDESAYVDSNGEVDQSLVQDAYNAVRVPIGVTTAAFLAALAAAAGVWINFRNVDVARRALAHSSDVETRRRTEWRAGHLHSRFQDAAKQLGERAAATRLAGVYAMATLADEWDEGRAACVDVLCAYARTPIETAAERTVRRALIDQIFRRLSVTASPSWSSLDLDLSDAFIETLTLQHPICVTNLNLDRAEFGGPFWLDHVVVKGRLSLDGAKPSAAAVRILCNVEHTGSISAGITPQPGAQFHLAVRHDPAECELRGERPVVTLDDLDVSNSSLATVSLRGTYLQNAVLGRPVIIGSGTLILSLTDGTAAEGAVRLHGRVEIESRDHVNVTRSLMHAVEGNIPVREQPALTFDPDPRDLQP